MADFLYGDRRAPAFDSLVGHRVLRIDVSRAHTGEDWDHGAEQFLRIAHTGGTLCVEAMGDCCSESWFADLTGLSALLEAPVTRVVELEMPESVGDHEFRDERTRQEWDQVYGYRIETPAGSATLSFRNSSNGYYGGWLEVREEEPSVEWRTIEGDDWHA